jgi:hypothetical protein
MDENILCTKVCPIATRVSPPKYPSRVMNGVTWVKKRDVLCMMHCQRSLNFTALLLESTVALSSHVTAFEIIARQTIYLGIWRLTDRG